MAGNLMNGFERVIHKLYRCPTFWSVKPAFTCPRCGKKYRCYWDGNDVDGVGVNYCDKCASILEAEKLPAGCARCNSTLPCEQTCGANPFDKQLKEETDHE